MTINDDINAAKEGVSLIGDIIKAAGDNAHVKEAADNLGQTAVTITRALNNALLPLAAVNFAFDKARIYFTEKFENDLAKKAAGIPADSIIEPKASIAGPVLQGLAFTHEEPNLKEMYLSLLATAMDGRVSEKAHPAFIEIIKQLNSEEANLLKDVLDEASGLLPIVEIRRSNSLTESNYNFIAKHLLNIIDPTTGEEIQHDKIAAMVENWIRLGLIEVDYDKTLIETHYYSWIDTSTQVAQLRQLHEIEGKKFKYQKGILGTTALGHQFAKAVGLLSL